MIDYKYGDLYLEDSIDKQLKIEAEDGTVITNEDLYSEEMTLTESLCSQESLTFGCCEASSLKLKIANQFSPLYGQKIVVSETLAGNEDEPFLFGTYKVDSDEPAADHIYRDITAYDPMYDILNADAEMVAEWYDTQILPNEDSTTTMKKFRTSFLELFGIEQEEVTLCNDDMVVEKTIGVTELSGSDVIHAICEINGCFGHISREGKFQYITLTPLDDGVSAHDIDSDYYTDCVYEDFETQPISKLQIRSDDDDIGATSGDGDNVYIVQDNFLVYGKSTEDLQDIADRLYEVIIGFIYRPATLTVKGNPCYEVGDGIHLDTTYQDITTYILKRTLRGIQALTDSYESNGVEQYDNTANSIENSIIQLKGRSNTLTRSLELTRSQITDVEANLQSTITQTKEEIEMRVSQVEDEINSIDKVSIVSSTLEYYVSDSDTELIGGEWSTDEPVRSEGKYIWIRTVVVTADGTENASNPACITADPFGIDDIVAYYAISESPTYYPPHDITTAAIVGSAIIGEAIIGNSGSWTVTQPVPGENEYAWLSFLIIYTDDSTQWTEPTLLTDDYAREQLRQTASQYADIVVDLNSITEEVYGLWTEVTENYVTTSEMTANIDASIDKSLATISISVSGSSNTYTYIQSDDFPSKWQQFNTDYGTLETITDPITGSGQCYQITQGDTNTYKAGILFVVGSELPAGSYHLSFQAATLSGYENTAAAYYGFDHSSGTFESYGATGLKSDSWTLIERDFELDGTDTEEFEVRLMGFTTNTPVLYKEPELTLISAEVLGSMAGIVLTTDDRILSSASLDLTEVRQAFADDHSGIEIKAGTVAFISNTLLINSSNCLLTEDGTLTVYDGIFYGTVTSIYEGSDSYYSVSLNGGGLLFYYEDDLMETMSTYRTTYNNNTIYGITSVITSNSDCYILGYSTREQEANGNWSSAYILNNGAYDYDELHIFVGDVRFLNNVYVDTTVYANFFITDAGVSIGQFIDFPHDYGIRCTADSGNANLLYMSTSENVHCGNTGYNLFLKGQAIYRYLPNYSADYTEIPDFRWFEVDVESTVANAVCATPVVFDRPYTKEPKVLASAKATNIGTTVLGVSVNQVTTTGCNVYATRTNASSSGNTVNTTVTCLIIYSLI